MHWEHWQTGAHLWAFHFFCLVLLGLLVWGIIYWLSHRDMRRSNAPHWMPHNEPDCLGGLDAVEVLRQRYARGEIDATTFERMREHLGYSDRSQG